MSCEKENSVLKNCHLMVFDSCLFRWKNCLAEISAKSKVPSIFQQSFPEFFTDKSKDIWCLEATWKFGTSCWEEVDITLTLRRSHREKVICMYEIQLEDKERRAYKRKGKACLQKGESVGCSVHNKVSENEGIKIFLSLHADCEQDIIIRDNLSLCEIPSNSRNSVLKYFHEKLRSDVVILNVGGARVVAHEEVLASKSPVFAAMFKHDMMEKKEGVVVINDISLEIVNEMLAFFYTNRVPGLNVCLAKSLLEVAEKYAVDDLKQLCEKYLLSNLHISNAIDFLIVGDTHQANNLKAKALEMICAKSRSLEKHQFEVLKDRPNLTYEVLLKFASAN